MQFSFHSISRRVAAWSTAVILCATAAAFLTSCKKETPPTSAAPDLSTPKKAATALANAMMAGDMGAMRQSSIGTEDQYAAVKGLGEMFGAMKRFGAAATKKFPDQAKMFADSAPDLAADIDKKEEKIDGDKATLVDKSKPNDKAAMVLKKDGGNWKVDLASMPARMSEGAKSAKKIGDAIDAVTKDVEGGKYTKAEDAMGAMQTAMFAAMAPAAPGTPAPVPPVQ